MTPTQREAALRLADALDQTLPADKGGYLCGEAAAILRELAQEPQAEPVANVLQCICGCEWEDHGERGWELIGLPTTQPAP